MNKFFTFLTVLVFVFSCSESDSSTDEKEAETQFPTVNELPDTPLNIGDVLIIEGSSFDVDETYVVTFEKDILGVIQELTVNSIKVQIPEGALSGEVVLSVNGEEKVIGTIEIQETSIIQTSKLYAYVTYKFSKDEGEVQPKIVELDPIDGSELSTVAIIGDNYYSDIVYTKPTNELIGQINSSEPINEEVIEDTGQKNLSEGNELLKINIDTGATTYVDTAGYESLIATESGRLFAYVAYDKIVELDPANGNELSTITVIGENYYGDIIYSEVTNELIGQINRSELTNDEVEDVEEETSQKSLSEGNELLKINVDTGVANYVDTAVYESLIINRSGKLFGYVAYDKIVEVNPANGSELSTIAIIGDNYYSDIVFSEATNELIGLINTSEVIADPDNVEEETSQKNLTDGNQLLKINIENGGVNYVDVGVYEALIIAN